MPKLFSQIDGVYTGATYCGIQADAANLPADESDKDFDLGYIYVPDAYSSAGVFTQHLIPGSAVTHTRAVIQNETMKAVMVNAGNANVLTGAEGAANTQSMASRAAQKLGLRPEEVGVASTGVIGKLLNIDAVLSGVDRVLEDPKQKDAAAFSHAILTTDLTVKTAWASHTDAKGKEWIVAGATKGSGMISPDMATTLGFLVTNIKLDSDAHQRILSEAVQDSYNMMSVDTDTSTSDMILSMSTGALDPADSEVSDEIIAGLFNQVCLDLAIQIADDGEGASHRIEVAVTEAPTKDIARLVAKSVVDSPLVKTAIAGNDPNWGRILMAIGKVKQAGLDVSKVSVTVQGVPLVKDLMPLDFDLGDLGKRMADFVVRIEISFGTGSQSATAYGCDLTHGYIKINTKYN